MPRHSELGYEILKGIDFLRDAAEIVWAHHERYDGNGYPRGLCAERIPPGARVFGVGDPYDARGGREAASRGAVRPRRRPRGEGATPGQPAISSSGRLKGPNNGGRIRP